jgi:hypothetical protein
MASGELKPRGLLQRVPSLELMEEITSVGEQLQHSRTVMPTEPIEGAMHPSPSKKRRAAPPSLQHPQHNDGDYEWLRARLCDGEAVTALSLAGNWAVALTPQRIGETIDYTVRDKVRIPGKEKFTLVALTGKFEYKVFGVFGELKGRAVALQPKGQENKMYVAFRGMRNREPNAKEDVGPAHDRRNFANATPAPAAWLPDSDMQVHAGVLEHHTALWSVGGLQRFLAGLATRCERGTYGAIDEIVFLGLSMGGALSEMCAFRAICEFPVMREKLHILSFGSIPWANAPVALAYDGAFGRRSVQLVLCRRAPAPDIYDCRGTDQRGHSHGRLHRL